MDRRVGGLDGLGLGKDRVEIDKLTVVLGRVVGPDRLHRLDALAHQLPAGVEGGAVVFHLFGIPATADAEEEASVRDMIDRGDLFRRGDRITLNDKTDAATDLEVLGGGGRCGKRHEWIHRLVVHLRQVGAAGPRAPSAGRDVSVLGNPVRLEATLLKRSSELRRMHRISRREDAGAEVHD